MHMNVFITVDVEVQPQEPNWRSTRLRSDIQRDIYGLTHQGEFGLRYQCDLFNQFGLKAVFFVESLFGSAVGLDPLKSMVDLIQGKGHEVQLHIHTEWLKHLPMSFRGMGTGYNIREFSEKEQTNLIALGLHNLNESGAMNISAFRAGNYGANFDTLRALAKNGVAYDTSYNYCFLDTDCGLELDQPLLQPAKIHDIYEFPISFISDWPGHFRHSQVTACSYDEITGALMQAWQQGWYSFVIVFHSMELLTKRSRMLNRQRPDWLLIRRFRRLCNFLASHSDKFKTSGFNEIKATEIPDIKHARIIKSSIISTAKRVCEQGIRRIWDTAS